MEYLILVLIVIIFYLRFSFWQEDKSNDEHLEKIKKMLEDVEVESPYKIEPIVATKRKTKKRTVKKKVVKKVSPKKKVVKKKTKRKTK